MRWVSFKKNFPEVNTLSTFAARKWTGEVYEYTTAWININFIGVDSIQLLVESEKCIPTILENYEWLDIGMFNGRDEETSIAKLRNKMGTLSAYFEFKKFLKEDNLDLEKKSYICNALIGLEEEILNQHWKDIINFIKDNNNW